MNPGNASARFGHARRNGIIMGQADLVRRTVRSPFFPIWPATVLLFAMSPLIAAGSLGPSALASTMPFAAVLAIASIGQTLVIQQRGLDLAVPGTISLAAILITKIPNGSDSQLASALVIVALTSGAVGLVSGFAVTQLRVTPLIATLGVNAIVLGVIEQITGGSSTATPAPALSAFALGKTVGVPNTVLVAAGLVMAVALFVRHTTVGRRFVSVGTSGAAAYVSGIPVRAYVWITYVAASLFYAAAAVLLAGYVGTPGLSAGNNYLLPSITAVVLGGASLAGGSGSVVGSAVGAVFLIQLQQDVFSAGAPTSVQYLIQAGVIGVAMAARNLRLSTALAARWASMRRPADLALKSGLPTQLSGRPDDVAAADGTSRATRA